MAAPGSTDTVSRLLADRPMGRGQVLAVAVAVALNALDGFDVLAITFAAPGITRDWGIGPAALGVALSSGLVGMALGSLLLAPLGDRYGRRPLILGCLLMMALGTGLTATATGLTSLCGWRIVTGLGIGGMVAAINAVAYEFANDRRRDLCVSIMTVGYPIGGLIGGFGVAELIGPYGWQSVFVIGGIVTALFLPVAFFCLPESLAFLARGGPAARPRIDALLVRLGQPPLTGAAWDGIAPAVCGSVAALFAPQLRRRTVALVAIYFLHMMTFYFFSGWLPKFMADLGYATADAIRTSSLMSMGGIIGGVALGWLAPRLGLVRLLAAAMLATSLCFAAFGLSTGLHPLQAISFVAGMGVFGGIVGLYAMLAHAFPPELRITGTGLAIGVGRGGSIVGPALGGVLIAGGLSIAAAIIIVGAGAALAAALLLATRASFVDGAAA